MKIKLTLLSIAILGIIPVAGAAAQKKQTKAEKEQAKNQLRAARNLCAIVSKMIQGGSDAVPFEMLKSARNFSQSTNEWVAYDSGIYLPGAQSCIVFTDRATGQQSFLQCKFSRSVDETTTDATVLDWEKQLMATLDPCLPRDWKSIDDRRQHDPGYFLKGEGDPGLKIEFQLMPKVGVGKREIEVNFYSK